MSSHIAIDYTPAYEQGGGIGRYVRELVSALAEYDSVTQYKLFVAGVHSNSTPAQISANFIWKPTQIKPIWLARLWHRLHIPLPVEAFTGSINLFHATDFVLPPTLPTTRTLLTVHDLSFITVPETATPSLKAYLDYVVPRSVRRADHILADSQATKDDLIKYYQTPSEKITVLLSGVDARFKPLTTSLISPIKQKYNLDNQRYILSVGTVQPRKNYSRVIRALQTLRNEGHDIIYAIAGGAGWLEDEMYQTIKDTGLDDSVKLLGFVDDADLPALYNGAECLVITSLYEGFGLPILEAMASGTPVITSNYSSLPEVAGDAAILINPLQIDEITDAIRAVISNHNFKNQLVEEGYKQARHFTWGKAAQQLHDVYTALLS